MLQALGGVLPLMAHLLYGVIGTGKELAVATAVEETGGMHSTEFDFTKLSIAERIQLAEDLWESIPPEGADLPLTEAQKAELDRRFEELEHEPDAGESWEVVRARLYDRLKRGE